MRVGYLGPAGTYTEEAVKASPEYPSFELVPLPTVYDTILAVEDRVVDRALVPIENSLEGSVDATLDALALEAGGVVITGEVVQPIRHCLMAREPIDLEDVRTVLSHPQASAQCARFIRTELPNAKVVATSSTAEAVRLIAQSPGADEGPVAAVGNRAAAELYGCTVLRSGIADASGNETRFVWIARRDAAAAGAAETAATTARHAGGPRDVALKSSVVFWGKGADAPGWLVRCLSEFAFRGVNLTRIESRPRKQGLGRYMFFVDLAGGADETHVAEAIGALRRHAEEVRVLGSYPAAS